VVVLAFRVVVVGGTNHVVVELEKSRLLDRDGVLSLNLPFARGDLFVFPVTNPKGQNESREPEFFPNDAFDLVFSS